MKNIKKKLVASVVSIGILFSGFGSVQAEEVDTGTVTYEIWDHDSQIINPNPVMGMGAHYYKSQGIEDLSEGEYTYAVYIDLTKSANFPFSDDPIVFRDPYLHFEMTQQYSSIEEAEEAAREYAENYVESENGKTHYNGYENVHYVFFDPDPIIEEDPVIEETPTKDTKVKKGKALGHDKNKAQGLAVGHDK